MSLMQKILGSVLLLLLLVFIGTYYFTFSNARHFFIQQMANTAQDTAASLGVSLTSALTHHDKKMMSAMVETVFDNGYFSLIEVRNLKGALLVSRHAPKRQHHAPAWFSDWIQWPLLVQSSVIMNGKQQIGDVLVVTDPDFACEALWQNACHLMSFYFMIAIVCLSSLFLLIRQLLMPLHRLIVHAEAICLGEHYVEAAIPSTREFKTLTLLLNDISNKRHIDAKEGW